MSTASYEGVTTIEIGTSTTGSSVDEVTTVKGKDKKKGKKRKKGKHFKKRLGKLFNRTLVEKQLPVVVDT